MHALSPSLLDELNAMLTSAGRRDLVLRLEEALRDKETLTSKQAAELLGVSSANTVQRLAQGPVRHMVVALRCPTWIIGETESPVEADSSGVVVSEPDEDEVGQG